MRRPRADHPAAGPNERRKDAAIRRRVTIARLREATCARLVDRSIVAGRPAERVAEVRVPTFSCATGRLELRTTEAGSAE